MSAGGLRDARAIRLFAAITALADAAELEFAGGADDTRAYITLMDALTDHFEEAASEANGRMWDQIMGLEESA